MEQTQTWYSKNKLIIIVIVVLGIFALYAWKTDLTFASYFNGQNVEPYAPDVYKPPVVPPTVKTLDESTWRRQFENDRK
jgi:hypothetical protein